jgi:hypothetical protein
MRSLGRKVRSGRTRPLAAPSLPSPVKRGRESCLAPSPVHGE